MILFQTYRATTIVKNEVTYCKYYKAELRMCSYSKNMAANQKNTLRNSIAYCSVSRRNPLYIILFIICVSCPLLIDTLSNKFNAIEAVFLMINGNV